MTVQRECFDVCKKIWELECRDKVKNLVEDFNKTSKEDLGTENDRGHFGYLARNQNMQFLGYLLVDKKRERIEKKTPMKVPKITGNEKNTLAEANYILEYFNQEVISLLTDEVETIGPALNPYSQVHYQRNEFNINTILDPDIFSTLIKEVEESSIVEKFLKILNNFSQAKDLTTEQFLKPTLIYIDRLKEYGVHGTPEDFRKSLDKFTEVSRESLLSQLIFLVMSFRESLRNIDQLLYQAFLSDQLVVLDENNIIQVPKHTTHLSGEGLTILAQPVKRDRLCELRDVILVKIESANIDKSCVVQGISRSFTQDFGNTQEFTLRTVDKNLNPFWGLPKHR